MSDGGRNVQFGLKGNVLLTGTTTTTTKKKKKKIVVVGTTLG